MYAAPSSYVRALFGQKAKTWLAAGLAGLIAVAIGVFGLVAPAQADDAAGVISGRVSVETDSDTRYALEDEVAVTLWSYDADSDGLIQQGTVDTQSDGTWTSADLFSSLPVGDYYIEYDYVGAVPNVVSFFNDGHSVMPGEALHFGDHFTVDTSAYDVGDTTLYQGADIHGTVRSQAALPAALPNQPVTLWRESYEGEDVVWIDIASTTTSAAAPTVGEYSFGALTPGLYSVEFSGASGYVGKWWDSAEWQSADEADHLEILAPTNSELADVNLAKEAKVSGVVKNTGGVGIPGIVVSLYHSDPWEESWEEVLSTTTGAGGAYTLGGIPAGEYRLGFASDPEAAVHYRTEYYNNQHVIDEADDLVVAAGQTLVRSAVLDRSSLIKGTVTAAGALDIEDAFEVQLCQVESGSIECWIDGPVVTYQANGAFTISNLAPGSYSYFVNYFGFENLQDEYFNNARSPDDAVLFTVGAAATVTGKNVQLDPGATISGTVSFGGEDVEGYLVSTEYGPSGYTDADGDYEITGLPSGSYQLQVSDLNEVPRAASQWYGGVAEQDESLPIDVVAPSAVTGVDFTLVAQATVSGTITEDGSGDPIADMPVSLESPFTAMADSEYLDYTYTDENGHYSFENVAPGTYNIGVDGDDEFLGQYANGAPGDYSGNVTPVVVAPGADEDVDLALARSGRYHGRLVSNGEGVSGIFVGWDGLSTYTDEDGYFVLTGFNGEKNVVLEIGDGGISPIELPVEPASAFQFKELGEFEVTYASTIKGSVVGTDGKPLKDVYVLAVTLDDAGEVHYRGESEPTATSGTFRIDGLPSGEVYLYFYPSDGKYPGQFLGGSSDVNAATPVVIDEPGDTVYTQARLGKFSTISGIVKDRVSLLPLRGVDVTVREINPVSGVEVDFETNGTVTSATGAYTLSGLAPGTYELTFNYTTWEGRSLASNTVSQLTIYVPENKVIVQNATLARTTKVSGIATTTDGLPLRGATVQAYRWNAATQTATMPAFDTAYTETSLTGAYTLNLDPGTYVIEVDPWQPLLASRYLGGGQDATAPLTTKLVVGATGLTGKNVVIPQIAGLDAQVVSSTGSHNVSGTIELTRIVGGVDQPSKFLYSDWSNFDTLFPLPALMDGDYRMTLYPDTRWGYAAPESVTTFTVAAGQLSLLNSSPATGTSLGVISLAPAILAPEPELDTSIDPPQVTSLAQLEPGVELTLWTGTWSIDPGERLSVQWLRDGKPITGATGITYIAAPGDVGKRLSANLYLDRTWYDGGLVYTTDTSELVVAGAAPENTGAPSITGVRNVGQTLTGNRGIWEANRHVFSSSWVRTVGATETVVSTNLSYTLVAADVTADSLEFRVLGTRPGYEDATASVDAGDISYGSIVRTTMPSWTIVGDNYTFVPGVFAPGGTVQSYRWVQYDLTTNTPHFAIPDGPMGLGYADGSMRVTLEVLVEKAGYAPLTLVIPVRTGPAVAITGSPEIGPMQLGVPVTVDTTEMHTTPQPATFSYQWYRGATAILGATSVTYTPTALDTGKSMSVQVTASLAGYAKSAPVPSNTQVSAGAQPVVTQTPTLTGTIAVGRTVSYTMPTWTPAPTTLTYQWYRLTGLVETPIVGATAAKYVPTAADLGHIIMLKVTGARAGYTTASVKAYSPSAVDNAPIANVVAPSIGLSASVGATLTATPGTWDLTPTSLKYQWFINDHPVIGATGTTYTPTVLNYGEEVRVEVTALKAGVTSSTPTSSASSTVQLGAAVKATGLPVLTVNGVAVTTLPDYGVVTATGGTWPVGGLSMQYQWQVNRDDDAGFVDLDGETSFRLLTNVDDDPWDFQVGWSYRVVVSTTRAGYLPSADITSKALVIG